MPTDQATLLADFKTIISARQKDLGPWEHQVSVNRKLLEGQAQKSSPSQHHEIRKRVKKSSPERMDHFQLIWSSHPEPQDTKEWGGSSRVSTIVDSLANSSKITKITYAYF